MSTDIIHCSGDGCPLRGECLRYRLIVYGRRASFERAPYDKDTGRCDERAPLEALSPTEAQIRLRAWQLWRDSGAPEHRALDHWLQAERDLSDALSARLRPYPDHAAP